MKVASVRSLGKSHYWLALTLLAALFSGCSDDSLSPAEQDIANFSQQLQGTWTLDKVSVQSGKSNGVIVAPVKEYACDKLSNVFQAKDVVNKYTISYDKKVVHVMKHYTCKLAPEELSWKIELGEQTGAESINWMSGKNFKIKEINEGSLSGELRLLFFNLDNCGPDGKPATSATKNKLRLEVVFDTKEEATFSLEFSKSQ
ncbi:hypothetical protein WBG78_06585 [Chryseolinea sp. T2]|uniref:hypothetical protein n=1 Tax=Chryseolinea sp. T2 TaxID=3129255 RepID=UPI0030778857